VKLFLVALKLLVAPQLQPPEFFLDDQLADEQLVQLLLALQLRVAPQLQLTEFFLDDQLTDEPLVQLLLALQLQVALQDKLQVLQQLDADIVEQDDQLVDTDQQIALFH
jgi:hypothetical protein